MARITKIENRFDKSISGNLLTTHRWAVVFGLVFPLLAYLLTISLTKTLFGVWPSVLSFAYEHVILFGWAGGYLFGLLYILLPEIFDIKSTKKTRKKYLRWLSVYAVGILFNILAVFFWLVLQQKQLFMAAIFMGSILELVGWLGAKYNLFTNIHHVSQRDPLYYHLFVIGMVPFTAALLLFPVLLIFLFGSAQFVIPQSIIIALRFLPMGAIGLIVLSLLIRLAPEMLDWRPLHEKDLKKIFALLLVSITTLLIGYTWFHFSGGLVPSIVYGAGAFLAALGVILLFYSSDIWHLNLIKSKVREYEYFIHASLIWLVLTGIAFILQVVFEISSGTPLAGFFTEAITFSFFAGFIGQAILGLYLYITHAMIGYYRHSDLASGLAVVFINWALLLKFCILPLMQLYGWGGAAIFSAFLNITLYVGLFLVSLDILHSLTGRVFKHN